MCGRDGKPCANPFELQRLGAEERAALDRQLSPVCTLLRADDDGGLGGGGGGGGGLGGDSSCDLAAAALPPLLLRENTEVGARIACVYITPRGGVGGVLASWDDADVGARGIDCKKELAEVEKELGRLKFELRVFEGQRYDGRAGKVTVGTSKAGKVVSKLKVGRLWFKLDDRQRAAVLATGVVELKGGTRATESLHVVDESGTKRRRARVLPPSTMLAAKTTRTTVDYVIGRS